MEKLGKRTKEFDSRILTRPRVDPRFLRVASGLKMHLTSLAAFKVALCIAHGLPVPFIVKIILDNLADQALNAPRRLPWFSTGNALGFNCPREYQHYGWPYYGAARSGMRPSLSREEFRLHLLFPSIVFAEVFVALRS